MPVKDSVVELRTRMARMLSIVEITSQRNHPVPEYISITSISERYDERSRQARADSGCEETWEELSIDALAIIWTVINSTVE